MPPDLMQLDEAGTPAAAPAATAGAEQHADSSALLDGLPPAQQLQGARARAADALTRTDLEAWLRAMTTARQHVEGPHLARATAPRHSLLRGRHRPAFRQL